MEEKPDEISIIDGLKPAIYDIRELAKAYNEKFPYDGFSLEFNGSSFTGECIHELGSSLTNRKLGGYLRIGYRGTLPLGKFTIDDLAQMSSEYQHIGTPEDLGGLNEMKIIGFDEVITKIIGDFREDRECILPEDIVKFLVDDQTYVYVKINKYGDHTYETCKDREPVRCGRRLPLGQIKSRGENKLYNWVINLCNTFQVGNTEFYAREYGKPPVPIPFQSAEINIHDFIFYLILEGNTNISFVKNVQSLISGKENGDQKNILIRKIDKQENGEIGQSKFSAFLVNEKINPTNEVYHSLISKETQKAIKFLDQFMKKNEGTYSKLLDSLEQKFKQQLQTV